MKKIVKKNNIEHALKTQVYIAIIQFFMSLSLFVLSIMFVFNFFEDILKNRTNELFLTFKNTEWYSITSISIMSLFFGFWIWGIINASLIYSRVDDKSNYILLLVFAIIQFWFAHWIIASMALSRYKREKASPVVNSEKTAKEKLMNAFLCNVITAEEYNKKIKDLENDEIKK